MTTACDNPEVEHPGFACNHPASRECPTCKTRGEVPEDAELANRTIAGFIHPNVCFIECGDCNGTGYIN